MAATLVDAVTAVPIPSKIPFADIYGDPKAVEGVEMAAALENAAAHLRHLSQLISTTNDIDSLLQLDRLQPVRQYTPTAAPPRNGILIEEVSQEDTEAARNQTPTCIHLLRVIATYGTDPTLVRPWSQGPVESAAHELYVLLEDRLDSRIVAVALPQLVYAVHDSITAYVMHHATEATKLEPYTGPDGWERGLAMSQLAWVLRQLRLEEMWPPQEQFLTVPHRTPPPVGLWNLVYPLLRAGLADPSPVVQSYALWAIEHAMNLLESTSKLERDQHRLVRAALGMQLVMDVRRAVIACDARAWPAAAAAAVALAQQVEQGSPLSSGVSSLFEALLEEGGRQAHVPERSLVWLKEVPQLFPRFGLQLVYYFSTLMPLLLGWCLSFRKDVRAAALKATHTALLATTPRVPAHARELWSVVDIVYAGEMNLTNQTSSEVVDAAIALGTTLADHGGAQFKDEIFRYNATMDRKSLAKRVETELTTIVSEH